MNVEEGTEAPDPRLGLTLSDRYRIVRRIGVGGMGVVYEGVHLLIQRKVAIKMLHVHFSGHAEILARFRREAIAATTIRHPHIVEVLDMGQAPDGAAYMVLEFLEGRDWSDDIDRTGAQPIGKAVRILREVCDGLQAAHDKNIVHRDLKPENVFLARHGSNHDFVKIVDFGISKMLDDPDSQEGGKTHNLTKTGAAMGTPYAMAPEQMKGAKDIDHRADIWALGVMLFRALTGNYPFDADTFPLLAVNVLTGEPPPLSQFRTDLPPELQQIVSRLLDKNRDTRFQTARDVRDALAPFESYDSSPKTTGRASMAMAQTMTPATPNALIVPAEKQAMASAKTGLDPATPLMSPVASIASAVPATAIGHRVTPAEVPATGTPPSSAAPLGTPPSSPATLSGGATPPMSPAASPRTSEGNRTGEMAAIERANTPTSSTLVEAPPAGPGQGAGVWTGAALAVVLIALGGGGAVLALRALNDTPPPPTTTAAPPSSVVAPPPTVATAPPSSAPPAVPAGATVRVQITTTPDSAQLFLDGNPIPNPFDADLPASTERHTLEARAEGYTTETREVSLAFPMRVAIELGREGSSHPHGTTGAHAHGTTPPPPPSTTTTAHVDPPPPPPPTHVEAPPPPTTTAPASDTSGGRHGHGLTNPFATH